MRSYHGWFSRFDQPDPSDASYDLANTQSLNRYAYVGNDPVNRTDPSGLDWDDDAFAELDASFTNIPGSRGGGGGGGGSFGGYGSSFGISTANFIPTSPEEQLYEQRVNNAFGGYGFVTTAQVLGVLGGGETNQLCRSSNDCWYDGMGTITTSASLAWHQRGILGTTGDFSRGVANTVSFGIVGAVHEARGEPRPDTTASTVGEWTGVGFMIAIPAASTVRVVGGIANAVRISFGHGARHLAGTGLSRRAVEGAIRAHVQGVARSASSTGNFWGRVSVGGRTIEYRAFTLPNGTVNVGTYYIPPGF